MSALRRDLFERKLWPVIVLLLVAVVAVPLTLRKNATANVIPVPPAPPVAGTVAPVQRTTARVSVHALRVSMPRDPFASGMPKLNAKPESQTKAVAGTSAATTSATTTSATSPSTVSPAPTTPSSATAATTPTTTTTTTTSTVSTPTTSTTGSTFSSPPPTTERSWTVYGVDVRVATGNFGTLRSDVARLTPLPSVAQPKAMFMGVMAGGKGAVFALGAGVQHVGPGVCRPDHVRCAAIVLRAGEIEHIIAPVAGGLRQFDLSVVAITSRVTHSADDALAAFRRHSAAGLCELDLADPVTFKQDAGTVSAVADTACKDQSAAVPFPGGLAAP